jgi:hypothetical protein
LYFNNSVVTAFNYPAIHKQLTFKVPVFVSVFCCLYPSISSA